MFHHELPQDVRDLTESLPPLSENCKTVLGKRYLTKDDAGEHTEDCDGLFWRTAQHISNKSHQKALKFYHLMRGGYWLPNSPTLANAGTRTGQLSACFVAPISDCFSNGKDGIYDTLTKAQLIQQTGGGVGFSFSRLRAKGKTVKTTMGQSSGPMSFADVYDVACSSLKQGGCLTPETLVHTSIGVLRLSELVNSSDMEYGELETTVLTDEGTRKTTASWNNGLANTLVVTLENGATIQGTPNHKLKVLKTDGSREWIRLDQLQAGDHLIQVMNPDSHMWGNYQLLEPTTKTYTYPAKVFNLPTELREELGWVLGYMWGDGFVSKDGSNRFGFAVADGSPVGAVLQTIFENLFGLTLRIQRKPNDASYCLIGQSQQIHDWFIMNELDKGYANDLEIPKIIRMSPKSVVAAFLSGLFEADGMIQENRPRIGSSSKNMLTDVQVLLVGMGVPSKLSLASKCDNRYSQKDFWNLTVYSGKGLERFLQEVSFIAGSRFEYLQHVVVDTGREQAWPIPNVHQALESVLATTTSSRKEPARKDALRYLRGDRVLKASSLERLGVEGDHYQEYYWSVVDVKEGGKASTLDLCVEDNHTYLANGFVSHNTRRGAQMLILRVDHPDIMEFIGYKADLSKLTNFNVSVAITDHFLECLKNNEAYELIDPTYGPTEQFLNARDVWNEIAKRAHATGEPGLWFIDRNNKYCPVPWMGGYEACNPCGEQALISYESCNLGSMTLDRYVREGNWKLTNIDQLREAFDLPLFAEHIGDAVEAMDNIIDVNTYVPSVPEIRETTLRTRKLGLGIMGLGRLLFKLGVAYDSPLGRQIAEYLYAFLDAHAHKKSQELAERGAYTEFDAYWDKSVEFHKGKLQERVAHANKSGFPEIAAVYIDVILNLNRHGLRNSTLTTVAPTGTLSIVHNTSGGCEPVFGLVFKRNQADTIMYETDPLFKQSLDINLPASKVDLLLAEIAKPENEGSLRKALRSVDLRLFNKDQVTYLNHVANVFVTAGDITPKNHVLMQAVIQKYNDSATSKTINFPESATVEEVLEAYNLAVETGCKGITVYRNNCRNNQPLSTGKVEKKEISVETPVGHNFLVEATLEKGPRHRPQRLHGYTERLQTGDGKIFTTLNFDEEGLREVVSTVGRSGGVLHSLTEAIGRLISVALKHRVPVAELANALRGIRSTQAYGFGKNQVLSIPDAIGKVIQEAPDHYPPAKQYSLIEDQYPEVLETVLVADHVHDEIESVQQFGNSPECPSCGSQLVFQSGCKGGTCTDPTCGWSKC